MSVKTEARFLRVIFHRAFIFKFHVSSLRLQCERALNFLKILSKASLKVYRDSLLTYRSLIPSFDNVCSIYYSARQT